MSLSRSSLFKPDIIFLLLIALYPLFLGGNRPFPQYFFGLCFTLNGLWVLRRYSSDVFQFHSLRLVLYGAATLLSAALLNVIFVSPNTILASASWILYCSYFTVFIQGIILATRQGFFSKFLKMMRWSGFFYAIYGLAILGMGAEVILFYKKLSYVDSLTSTFINRNHFALFGVMCWLAVLHYFLQKMKQNNVFSAVTIQDMIVRFIGFITMDGLLPLIKLIIISAAILLSQSRSGLLLLLISMACLTVGSLFYNRSQISWKKAILSFVICFIAVVTVFSHFSTKTADRFHYAGASLSERSAVWNVTIKMIKDKPFFGHGLKNFEFAFNHYRDENIPLKKRWDKAHNDFLEIISEFGLVFSFGFFGFIGWCCFYLLKAMQYHKRLYHDNLFVLSIVIIILLHSLIDFGMQMPANMVLFTALLSSALSRSIRSN